MRRWFRRNFTAGLGCAAALTAVLIMVPDLQPGTRVQAASMSADKPDWDDIAEELNQKPVDAKLDRIWKAIPGLNGWNLDVQRSQRLTQQDRDGRVHLVWSSVKPSKNLNDLEAAPIYRGPKQEKSAALMFNVSWGEEYVPELLKVLKQSGIKATFFLDGAWVNDNPDLAKEIAVSGQDIGSHGIGHKDFRRLSTGQLANQLEKSARVIGDRTGANVRLIAPPAGSYDNRLVQVASAHQMKVILWSVDTIDWRRPPANQIIHRVTTRIQPGSLILMHPTASTVKALPSVIGNLKEKGYIFKTVQQVVSEQSVVRPPTVLKDPL